MTPVHFERAMRLQLTQYLQARPVATLMHNLYLCKRELLGEEKTRWDATERKGKGERKGERGPREGWGGTGRKRVCYSALSLIFSKFLFSSTEE